MKTRPGTRSTRAFTLLEVMMVVAIVGLVVAMGVPSMLSEWHAHGRYDVATFAPGRPAVKAGTGAFSSLTFIWVHAAAVPSSCWRSSHAFTPSTSIWSETFSTS